MLNYINNSEIPELYCPLYSIRQGDDTLTLSQISTLGSAHMEIYCGCKVPTVYETNNGV